MSGNRVIIFKNSLGGVAVCYPTGELPIEIVQQRDIPYNVVSHIVDSSVLPTDDDDFFDAWELDGAKVVINFQKAVEIAKNRLRKEREPLLSAQDVAFQRALENGSDTSAIVAEKQRLRNITLATDSCTTLDQLRALKVAN